MISLGQNLYLWRIFKGLSQGKLAKRAGIPRPNLTAIEGGRHEPSLSTLRLLAASLGIDAGTLINGVAPVNFTNSVLSRESQEAIAKASLGKKAGCLTPEQKIISSMLSSIIKNKINARDGKFSGSPLKNRQLYVRDWLMLKAGIEARLLDKVLAQIDKYI